MSPHSRWKDYQIEVTDPGPLFAVLVANVGDAEIDGVTLDFSALLWESLDVGLNLQLLDAKTKADEPVIGLLPGERLPFSAEEKGSIWAEYTFPGEFAGGNFYARLQWSYMGNSLNGLASPILDDEDFDGDDDVLELLGIVEPTLQPAYQITDFKVGLAADDWEIYAYVDNVFDERPIYFDQFTELLPDSSIPGFTPSLRINNFVTIGDPRSYGIGFSKSWGGGN
jgi:iron complex outermembrane receptor protein